MNLHQHLLSRRRLLALAGTAAATAALSPLAFAHSSQGHHGHSQAALNDPLKLGANDWSLPEPRKIRLATNLNAVCLAPVAIADTQGFFRNHNLEVEFVNFGHSTEVMLEALATGKADGATGMALRWLKSLESGLDVKLTAGTHGGCLRLLTTADGPRRFEDLKGATIGATDMAAPDKNFFSLMLKRYGVDPARDVTWRVYPVDLLETALARGEVRAITISDPMGFRVKNKPAFRELSTNLVDDYASMSCCVVGVSGNLARREKPVAAALTHAILQAHTWAAQHPEVLAQEFLKLAVNTTAEEIQAIFTEHTHDHYSTGNAFVKELAVYARDLREIEVLRSRTDPVRFAETIHADIFA